MSFEDLKPKSAANIVLKTPSSERTQEMSPTYPHLRNSPLPLLLLSLFNKNSFLRDNGDKYLTGGISAKLGSELQSRVFVGAGGKALRAGSAPGRGAGRGRGGARSGAEPPYL